MSDTFPKYNPNRQTAEKGITIVKQIVENELNWIFRQTPLEHDFGIDGYIDILNSDNGVTGKYIGIQIKTGESYFKNEKADGWDFRGEIKHLNYYLNLDFPVLIILVDLSTNLAYWTEFDMDKVSKITNGWSLRIKKNQKLEKNAKGILRLLPGEEIDYFPQIEYQWAIDEKIKSSGLSIIAISKEEIEELNFTGFTTLMKRLTANDEIIKKSRGKISFVIFGYEEDKRELFEIEEVKQWAKSILPIVKYWGYFLNMEPEIANYAGLKILHYCSTDCEKIGQTNDNADSLILTNPDQTIEFMNKIVGWMNEFADLYGIDEELNKEQFEKVIAILFDKELNQM